MFKTLEEYLSYDKKPRVFKAEDVPRLNQFYAECIILEDGNILELVGSHEMTVAKHFSKSKKVDYNKVRGADYWVKKHGVIFVNSRDVIFGPIEPTPAQTKTLNYMVSRNWLSKNYGNWKLGQTGGNNG